MYYMFSFILLLLFQMLAIAFVLGTKDAAARIGELIANWVWMWWSVTILLLLFGVPTARPAVFMSALSLATGHTLVAIVAYRSTANRRTRRAPNRRRVKRAQQLAKTVGMRVHQDDAPSPHS